MYTFRFKIFYLSVVWRAYICYLLCNNLQIYRSASVIVNASNKEIQVFGRNLYDIDETNSILEIRSNFWGDEILFFDCSWIF